MKTERAPRFPVYFIIAALAGLLGALLIGCLAAFQFSFPGLLDSLGFVKSRPLHVALAVAWIFLSAAGGIYFYVNRFLGYKWYSIRWPMWQLILILVTGTGIVICYAAGIFGGREYWEHPAFFSVPIVVSWLLLVVNFFKTIFSSNSPWPAYVWMWATGVLFFLVTFLESNLWIFPFFRDNLVRDLTVQWKSYGALVGSWNMLVYGTAAFLVEKLSGNKTAAQSRTAFLLFFLGFTNLLFGWAHHTYTLPSASWIRNLSYVISMTELLILWRLIADIKKLAPGPVPAKYTAASRFMISADRWILLNLIVALAISVPALNLYTHGTHVTVAHAMGSAIGINTMILLSSCAFIAETLLPEAMTVRRTRFIRLGLLIANISLVVFWLSLVWAGVEKGILMIHERKEFAVAASAISPQLRLFAFAGLGLATGFGMVIAALAAILVKAIKRKEEDPAPGKEPAHVLQEAETCAES